MKTLLDIEVFWTHFEVSIEDYNTNESKCFMVNEFCDNREELKSYLNSYKGFMITFNGIRYDFAVLTYLQINNWFVNLLWDQFCFKAKEFSDKLINTEDELFVYQYIDRKFKGITHIDLMLYWSKGLRQSKKISLKGLGVQLNYPVIQELPYEPDIPKLNKEQIDEIHHYCSVHDLGILRLLLNKMNDEVNLRQQILNDYSIPCWSFDAPKIASEALINYYGKTTNQSRKDVLGLRFDRPTFKFGDLFDKGLFSFKTPIFQSVFEEWMNSRDTFSKEFIVGNIHPLKLSVGVGGIHSLNDCEVYKTEGDWVIKTSDVASLYPNLILRFKAFRFEELNQYYKQIMNFRLTETKPMIKKFKGTDGEKYWKQKDSFFKLLLNSTSGLLDNEYSWLFNPIGIMKVRVGGQLMLLTLIEECLMSDIIVVSANTDGVEVKLRKDQLDLYDRILKKVSNRFNLEFETETYKSIFYASVNSYIAINESGYVKEKGEFVRKPELGNSTDFLIIANVLGDYFVKGIKPEESIRIYEDIFLFCGSQKVSKQFNVYWNGDKLPQRLNRYYASKKGAYLYKLEKDESWQKRIVEAKTSKDKKRIANSKPNFQHLLKESGVQLYNIHEDKPIDKYEINYSFYLNKINKKIAEIERLNQLTLF